MTPSVVRIDPEHDVLRLLVPDVAGRIRHYATQYQPDVDAVEYSRTMIGRLWVADARVLILGLVEPDSGKLVGHVLATHEKTGRVEWVLISQHETDDTDHAPLETAVDHVAVWAKGLGVKKLMLATPSRKLKKWEKAGFQFYRHVLQRPLDPDPEPGG